MQEFSSTPSYGAMPAKGMPALECAVCGARAFFRHFGGKPVCKPCAAFFRRTVALKKTFKCKTRGNCNLQLCPQYLDCKSCRFRKCIDAGMMVGSVVSSERTSAPQTPLDRIEQARKAVYMNRVREATELCTKFQVNRYAPLTLSTLYGIDLAIRAEFGVVCDFLKQSGVCDYFVEEPTKTCPRVAISFLSTWDLYEWMWTTIRNFGHYSRRLFFLDETYTDLTERSLSEFYGADPDLLDPWHVASFKPLFTKAIATLGFSGSNPNKNPHGVLCYGELLETSERLARARLDEAEIAVLTLILLFRSVKEHRSDDESVRLGPLLDCVFRNLSEHYKQTYEDYALRLDVIVHLADEVRRIRRIFDEHLILLRLSGRKTIVAKMEDRLSKAIPLLEE